MPIYRNDAASLHSHDRLRYRQMSEVDLEEPSQTLQGTCNVAPEQNLVEEGPDDGTPEVPTCLPQNTSPISSTRNDNQNGGSPSSIIPETARGKQVKTWRARWQVLRSSMKQRRNGAEDANCQIAKPIARGVQWIGQGCLCRDKDEDESGDEITQQSIRLVQV